MFRALPSYLPDFGAEKSWSAATAENAKFVQYELEKSSCICCLSCLSAFAGALRPGKLH
jgi:hypothetical protein